jgi:phosphate transport system ATP-binding protein
MPNAISVSNLRVRYGSHEALKGISFDVAPNTILGVIGPAQSGKTTMLAALNRGIDWIPDTQVSGNVQVLGRDVREYANVSDLRRQVGMVAPLPVGLPMTVFENVAFAPRLAGMFPNAADLAAHVEQCLRQAALWDEVKDRLDELGTRLSGGQQQRLTLARALSHRPSILCLDEFSIAIDPVTTMRIEEILAELKRDITIVLVTNLTQQARRLADRTLFLLHGEIVEQGPTEQLFSADARDPRTRAYVQGEFG